MLRKIFRQVITREGVTGLLAITSGLLSAAYAVPGLGVPAVLPAGRLSIAAGLGVLWLILFAACALLLVLGMLRRSPLAHVAGHVTGAAVSAGWFAALLFGALASRPVGSVLAAILAAAMAVLHIWCAVDYGADRGGDDDAHA